MNDPEEPRSTYQPAAERPACFYDGAAAIVTLFSWGTERSPAYSLRIVRIIEGRMTCGRTFTAGSFAELRQEAPNHAGRDQATLDDVDRCLTLAGWQLDFPYTDEATTP